MPLNGSGTASKPSGTTAVSNTTIESSKFNSVIDDIYSIFNTARPLAYGGTGGTSQITGWDGLSAKGTDIASAGTINLTTATGPRIDITGTTTITAVTLASGSIRIARATGIFQITASASLVVNKSTSVNYTTAVGDLLIFIADSTVVSVTAIGAGAAAASNAEVLAGTVTDKYVSPATAYFPTGHLYGLTLSNNVSDATNDIDIAAGTARDGSDTYNMILGSSLTKRLDASWAVGTGNGGLDTGSVGNNTYYVWLIKRSDTGVVDALFSLSSTAPTMPTNYDAKVLIGSFARAGGVNGVPVGTGTQAAGVSGSLTLTLTGCTTSPTITVKFTKVGRMVTLAPVGITGVTGTSNATSKTFTGIPAALYPADVTTFSPSGGQNNGGSFVPNFNYIKTDGVIELLNGIGGSSWTNSGTFTYYLNAFSYLAAS